MTITHVCLSDLHLGAETSLLTDLDPSGASQSSEPSLVLAHLGHGLRELVSACHSKPTLVLAGDVLELALAQTHESAMCFERFLDAFFPAGEDAFSPQILYIPGNHDHHLWESARDEYYAEFIDSLKPDEALTEPWHVTPLYRGLKPWKGQPKSGMLRALAARHKHRTQRKAPVEIQLVYPNHGIYDAASKTGTRSVVISHGHYVEPIYHLMSELRRAAFPDRPAPTAIEEIEAQNFAWVDFFWSTMGRSGGAGDDIQLFYELAGDPEGIPRLASPLATTIVNKWLAGGVPDFIEAALLSRLLTSLGRLVIARERSDGSESLGAHARQGLRDYIDGPLYRQISREFPKLELGHLAPDELTFVFGHTHKPFEEMLGSGSFAKPVKVINTGGWVVDTIGRQPLHGASVVFIDDALDCAALRMFDEPARKASPRSVRVAEDPDQPDRSTPLAELLRAELDRSAAQWDRFSEAVGIGIQERAEALIRRTGSRSAPI